VTTPPPPFSASLRLRGESADLSPHFSPIRAKHFFPRGSPHTSRGPFFRNLSPLNPHTGLLGPSSRTSPPPASLASARLPRNAPRRAPPTATPDASRPSRTLRPPTTNRRQPAGEGSTRRRRGRRSAGRRRGRPSSDPLLLYTIHVSAIMSRTILAQLAHLYCPLPAAASSLEVGIGIAIGSPPFRPSLRLSSSVAWCHGPRTMAAPFRRRLVRLSADKGATSLEASRRLSRS